MTNGPIFWLTKQSLMVAEGYECDHCRRQCACNEYEFAQLPKGSLFPSEAQIKSLMEEWPGIDNPGLSAREIDLAGGAADNGDSLCSVCHEAYRKGNA